MKFIKDKIAPEKVNEVTEYFEKNFVVEEGDIINLNVVNDLLSYQNEREKEIAEKMERKALKALEEIAAAVKRDKERKYKLSTGKIGLNDNAFESLKKVA